MSYGVAVQIQFDDDTKTTSTAAYAAVAANISTLLAFVRTPTLAANKTVNIAMSPSCAVSRSSRRSSNIAPKRSTVATTVLIPAATQETCRSSTYSVSSVTLVVLTLHH